MSPSDLRTARPGVELGADGIYRESFFHSWIVYGFSPHENGRPPSPDARLYYVERSQEIEDAGVLRRTWMKLLRALEVELRIEPVCAKGMNGSTTLRQARFEATPEVVVASRVTDLPGATQDELVLTAAVLAPGTGGPDGSSADVAALHRSVLSPSACEMDARQGERWKG